MTNQWTSFFQTMRQAALFGVAGIACLSDAAMGVDQIVRPTADGTIVDGGSYGPFDGTADSADWTFNESGYEGAITLSYAPIPGFERRVVFEFDLNTVTTAPPVVATLSFRLRGAPRFPAPTAGVEVYAYPADLVEQLSDFSAGPSLFVAEAFVIPFQPATLYEFNVDSLINEALVSGTKKVGFRFKIDPETVPDANQAFMDVLDSDLSTKPLLTLVDRIPGDFDGDRDVDVGDYALLAPCILGPDQPVLPVCERFDLDLDGDVDLADFSEFLHDIASYGR